MSRVLILSGIQISTNPRVIKEANALANAGYEVEVVSSILEPGLVARDEQLTSSVRWKHTNLIKAGSSSRRERLNYVRVRLRRRAWREIGAKLGLSDARQLGYAAPEMLQYALDNRADLTILHLPQSLWVGAELAKLGRTIAVDFEDWYSEDLNPQDRAEFTRSGLRRWEREVLTHAAYATTTSACLSDALADAYHVSKPTVVPNAFPLHERDWLDGKCCDRRNTALPSICWFSQVIGPDRGLETLADALHHITVPFEIHLRGTVSESFRAAFVDRLPRNWRDKVFFHPQVTHRELISRIAEHDLGLACDVPANQSRSLTITNKALQYLLAGIPIIASNTEGHLELAANAPGALTIYSASSARHLAAVLTELLDNRPQLARSRENALAAATATYSWERIAPRLLSCVHVALSEERGVPRPLPAAK